VSASLVYIDTSVGLAHLLDEDVRPPERLWKESLVPSRLMEYEAWRRLHALGLAQSHGESLTSLLSAVSMLDLPTPVVERARDAFPRPVRTLDALHLASVLFLVEQGQKVQLATYDRRLETAAGELGIQRYDLG
jgi:predicted nucleic acid-binding protein